MFEFKNTIREVQKVEINILKEVTSLCKRHGIRYFISRGTLLGAVRHKGFIPWDDDADIVMPREDYDRFLEIAPKELPAHLFVQHHTTDSKFYLLITKIRDSNTTLIEPAGFSFKHLNQGIFVDIFPLDLLPKSKPMQIIVIFLLRILWKCFFMKRHCFYTEQNLIQRIHLAMYKLLPIGSRLLANIYERLCRKCGNKNSDFVDVLVQDPRYSKIKKRSWFTETRSFEFEGELFDGPACYDEVLTHAYGNYMEYPPEEERKPKHAIFFDPYKCYKEYVS